MNFFKTAEKSLKRTLKRKFSISFATIVTFAITGNLALASSACLMEKYDVNTKIAEGEQVATYTEEKGKKVLRLGTTSSFSSVIIRGKDKDSGHDDKFETHSFARIMDVIPRSFLNDDKSEYYEVDFGIIKSENNLNGGYKKVDASYQSGRISDEKRKEALANIKAAENEENPWNKENPFIKSLTIDNIDLDGNLVVQVNGEKKVLLQADKLFNFTSAVRPPEIDDKNLYTGAISYKISSEPMTIKNVAEGKEDNDAVNYAQLREVADRKNYVHVNTVTNRKFMAEGYNTNYTTPDLAGGALGNHSIAVGENAVAGTNLHIMGKEILYGENAIAIGHNSLSEDDDSISMGASSNAHSKKSIAIGKDTRAGKKVEKIFNETKGDWQFTGLDSAIAIGDNTKTSAGIGIGKNINNVGIAIGENLTSVGIAIGFGNTVEDFLKKREELYASNEFDEMKLLEKYPYTKVFPTLATGGAIAIGTGMFVGDLNFSTDHDYGLYSIGIGNRSHIQSNNSILLGNDSSSDSNYVEDVIIIGNRLRRVVPTTSETGSGVILMGKDVEISGTHSIILNTKRSDLGSEMNADGVIALNSVNSKIDSINSVVVNGYGNKLLSEGVIPFDGYITGSEPAPVSNAMVLNGNNNAISLNNSSVLSGGFNSVGQLAYDDINKAEKDYDNLNCYTTRNGDSEETRIIERGEYSITEDNVLELVGSTILNGVDNHIIQNSGVIGNGFRNNLGENASYSSILNGNKNSVNAMMSTILTGNENKIEGDSVVYSMILNGNQNTAGGSYSSTVLNGAQNNANGLYSIVLNGNKNIASGDHSLVNGQENNVQGYQSSILNGTENFADGAYTSILNGYGNRIDGTISTVAGGYNNELYGNYSFIANGYANKVAGNRVYIMGSKNKVGTIKKPTDPTDPVETTKMENVYILGSEVDATNVSNAVVLGDKSTAVVDAISIGSDTKTRNIKFVKEGEISSTSKDAINGSQLYGVGNSVVTNFGENATLDATGNISFTNIGGTNKNTIHEAIAFNKENIDKNTKSITNLGNEITKLGGTTSTKDEITSEDSTITVDTTTAGKVDLSVTNNSITSNKLVDNSVTTTKIANNSVTKVKLGGDVTNILNKIGTGTIDGTQNNETVTGTTVKTYITKQNFIKNSDFNNDFITAKLTKGNIVGDSMIEVKEGTEKVLGSNVNLSIKDGSITKGKLTTNIQTTLNSVVNKADKTTVNDLTTRITNNEGTITNLMTNKVNKNGDNLSVDDIKNWQTKLGVSKGTTVDLSNRLTTTMDNLKTITEDAKNKLVIKLSENANITKPTGNLVTDTMVNEAITNTKTELETKLKTKADKTYVDNSIKTVNEKVTKLDTKVSNLDTKVNNLTTNIGNKADKTYVDNNINKVGEKITKLDTKVSSLTTNIENKADKDGENITNISNWQDKLKIGTGTIDGTKNDETVTGSTVKSYITKQDFVKNSDFNNNFITTKLTKGNIIGDSMIEVKGGTEKVLGSDVNLSIKDESITKTKLSKNLVNEINNKVNINGDNIVESEDKKSFRDNIDVFSKKEIEDKVKNITVGKIKLEGKINEKEEEGVKGKVIDKHLKDNYVNKREMGAVASTVNNMRDDISKNRNELRSSGAMSAALAGLHPMQYEPNQKNQLMAAVGLYRDKKAIAVGLSHHVNKDLMFTAGVTAGQGKETKPMGNLGFTWRMGAKKEVASEDSSSISLIENEIAMLRREDYQQKYKFRSQEEKIEKQNKKIDEQQREIEGIKKKLELLLKNR